MSVTTRMPVLFIGHGSPMNAIEDNAWSRSFRELALTLPEPRAILAISAHWFVDGTFATDGERPETIHDFGGFPEALYQVQYPAPGDPALAKRVVDLLSHSKRAALRGDWGLDHGTWSVLLHLRPAADRPVVQLSIDGRSPPFTHLEIGRALAPLRDDGVLILASGNIVHNLRHAFASTSSGDNATPDWATRFDTDVASAITKRDAPFLARALDSSVGQRAHPSPDHYLPLLYAAGASDERDAVSYPIAGFAMGSLSMRAVRWG